MIYFAPYLLKLLIIIREEPVEQITLKAALPYFFSKVLLISQFFITILCPYYIPRILKTLANKSNRTKGIFSVFVF